MRHRYHRPDRKEGGLDLVPVMNLTSLLLPLLLLGAGLAELSVVESVLPGI